MPHSLPDLIAGVVLSGLCTGFIFAGAEKMADRERFFTVLLQVPRLPYWCAQPLSRWLPVAEMVLGAVALLLQWRLAVLALALLNFSFVAVISEWLSRGSRVSCACFGELSQDPVGPWDLARNLLMGGLLLGLAPGVDSSLGWAARTLTICLGATLAALWLSTKRLRQSAASLTF